MHKANTADDEEEEEVDVPDSLTTEAERKALHFFETGQSD